MLKNTSDFKNKGLLITRFNRLGLPAMALVARSLRPVIEIDYAYDPQECVTVGLEAKGETGKTPFCENLLGIDLSPTASKNSSTEVDWSIGWNDTVRARVSGLSELGNVVWMDALGLTIEQQNTDPSFYRAQFLQRHQVDDIGGVNVVEHCGSCTGDPKIKYHVSMKKDWDDFYFKGVAQRSLDIGVTPETYESEHYQAFLQRLAVLSPALL